jgi:hypothetical protein
MEWIGYKKSRISLGIANAFQKASASAKADKPL